MAEGMSPLRVDPPLAVLPRPSGTPRLDAAARQLLLALEDRVEPFLVQWKHHMERAGYLAYTTAKREDCIRSYVGFLEPLWHGLRSGEAVDDFAALLQRDPEWAAAVLVMSQRHRLRGITPEMFIGCIKTLVHAIVDLLHAMAAPVGATAAAVAALRSYADAMEVALIADWGHWTQRDQMAALDESNRLLTLQRNRFENIFATTSDLVLVADAAGRVEDANQAARALLGDALDGERPIWKVLELPATSLDDVLRRHPPPCAAEVRLAARDVVLELRIAPLSAVSLASSGYLFVLSDITLHVRQRAELEQRVRERTAELESKTVRLEEMNVTLRNVLASIDGERKEYRRSVAQTVETLLPTLKVLEKTDDAAVRHGYASLLGSQLQRLYDGAGSDARLLALTPTELKVCQFIRAGSRTKEIAESLNLSTETVQTHRKSIRHKLRLSGKDVNLYTFLQTVLSDASTGEGGLPINSP